MEAMTILLSSKIIEELITDYYWYIVIQSSFNPKIDDLGTGFNGRTVTKWSNSVTVFFFHTRRSMDYPSLILSIPHKRAR